MEISNKYPVYDVSNELSSGAVEYLGSKYKGWITLKLEDKEFRVLFKQGRPGTGENWAEKVTCELAKLLGLPHALYDLAKLGKNELCVISRNFLVDGDELRLGNELIEGFDKTQKFKNSAHTLGTIFNALAQNKVQLFETSKQEAMIKNVSDLFIGYLCFDVWIGNTDRHAENWGVIIKANNTNILAPTFDHASSLGRNESDARRIKRLQTKDKGFNVKAYAQRAEMPIYNEKGYALNMTSLIQGCKNCSLQTTHFWLNKIMKIMNNAQEIQMILDKIPDEFITKPAKDFAMAILYENAKRLRELQND
jgi:hypothetical protein